MTKNILLRGSLFTAIAVISYIILFNGKTVDISDYSTNGLNLNYTVHHHSDSVLIAAQVPKKIFSPSLGKTFEAFKEALGFKESQGNYSIINPYGYLGKYQFGEETLKMIGIYDTEAFLNTPELQEKAFLANTKRNKWILRKDIKQFKGKIINGTKITESGILAAAHLAGPNSVKKYLRSFGTDTFSDANGATIRYYIKKFAGYDTSFLKANRKAKVKFPESA